MREWGERGMLRGRAEGRVVMGGIATGKRCWDRGFILGLCELQRWLCESGAVRECSGESCEELRLGEATVSEQSTPVPGLCEKNMLGWSSTGIEGDERLRD